MAQRAQWKQWRSRVAQSSHHQQGLQEQLRQREQKKTNQKLLEPTHARQSLRFAAAGATLPLESPPTDDGEPDEDGEEGQPKLCAGMRMRALKPAPYHGDSAMAAKRLGNLKRGEVFVITETSVDGSTDGSISRVRLDRGWVSLHSKAGALLLEAVDESKEGEPPATAVMYPLGCQPT
eukprot:SAG11_NODE_171_length_13596_cov_15.767356_10_plen_178_part_00